MLKYGNDKPDLRNPIEICDVTELFAKEEVTFNAFKNVTKAAVWCGPFPPPVRPPSRVPLRQAQ